MSATLWNRTRTSRASAERADQLRKSGDTSAARVWCTRSADHHHRSSVVRDLGGAGRTSGREAFALSAGAPRALRRSPVTRAQLSRFEIWIRDRESKIQIVVFADAGPENVEGRLGGSLGGLRTRRVLMHVTRVEGLRRYPYRAPSRRSSRNDGPGATRASWSRRACDWLVDYVELVFPRRILRTMKRITVRERSVKLFLDKIHNHAHRLLFRHRGELSNATTLIGCDSASST
jgi:hypothetical protein